MPSLNRVQIIGNVGRDAEVRYSPGRRSDWAAVNQRHPLLHARR